MSEIVNCIKNEETLLQLRDRPCFLYELYDGFEAAQMQIEEFEKYQNIVDVNQGMVSLNWSQNSFCGFLKRFQSIFQPKYLVGILISIFVLDKRRLVYVIFVKLDLSTAISRIQFREDVGWSGTFNAFVHSRYEVTKPYCACSQFAKNQRKKSKFPSFLA